LKLKQLKPVEKYNQANSNLKPQETPIQQEQTPLKEAQKQDTITHENFENKTTESKNTDDKAIIKLEAKNVINENIFKF
jgi:hypothetical protein